MVTHGKTRMAGLHSLLIYVHFKPLDWDTRCLCHSGASIQNNSPDSLSSLWVLCVKWTAFIPALIQTRFTILPDIHPLMHAFTYGGVNRALPLGHLDTPQGGAGDRTSNLAVTSQPALPPELLPVVH